MGWQTVLGIIVLFFHWRNLITSKTEVKNRATTVLCKVIITIRRTQNNWIPVITSEKWHWGKRWWR